MEEMLQRTLTEKETKRVTSKSTGQEKANVTMHLSCLAGGTKLPMFVIVQRKRELEGLPEDVIIHYDSKSRFMAAAAFKVWYEKVVQHHFQGRQNLIIIDGHSSHKSPRVQEMANYDKSTVKILPPNLTFCLQPLDVFVNKPFKDRVRKLITQWHTENEGRIQIVDFIRIAKDAWNAFSETIIHHSFEVMGIVCFNGRYTFYKKLRKKLTQ